MWELAIAPFQFPLISTPINFIIKVYFAIKNFFPIAIVPDANSVRGRFKLFAKFA